VPVRGCALVGVPLPGMRGWALVGVPVRAGVPTRWGTTTGGRDGRALGRGVPAVGRGVPAVAGRGVPTAVGIGEPVEAAAA
jgi:hypothetical protein